MVIALRASLEPGRSGLQAALGFLPAAFALAATLLTFERNPALRRLLSWAWVVVFDLFAIAFLVATMGESADPQLLAFLLLGVVVATARNRTAGALSGLTAGAGYATVALRHGSLDAFGGHPLVLWATVLLLLAAGLFIGFIAQAADLERERHAARTAELQEELANLGEHLKNVLSCVASGVLVVDAEGRITTYNRAAERILGVPEHTVLGRAVPAVPALAELGRLLARPAEELELRRDAAFVRPDGTTIQIGYAATPLVNTAAQRLGKILVFQDVTLVRDYEARMLRQEQLAALGRMVSGIAHEFGNQLGGARGLLDMALLDEDPGEAVRQLPLVRDTVSQALKTVEHLLRFARARPLERVPGVALDEVLQRALQLESAELDARGIEPELRLEPVPRLEADALQLQQVLLNLIINALHALQDCEAPRLRLSLRREGGDVLLRVEDSGPGVPPEVRERVFEPFFTTKGSLGGSETPGTGLGLSVALGVVEGHDGRLSIGTSAELAGACFTVALPVPPEESASTP